MQIAAISDNEEAFRPFCCSDNDEMVKYFFSTAIRSSCGLRIPLRTSFWGIKRSSYSVQLVPDRVAGEAGANRSGSADWKMEIRVPCKDVPTRLGRPPSALDFTETNYGML